MRTVPMSNMLLFTLGAPEVSDMRLLMLLRRLGGIMAMTGTDGSGDTVPCEEGIVPWLEMLRRA